MKIEKRKILKLGISQGCLQKLIGIHEQMGTRTLTEAVMRIVDEYEERTEKSEAQM